MSADHRHLFTVAEVAQHFRCSEDTIRRYIKQGELHAFRIKRVWLIPESALSRCATKHDRRT